MNNIEVFQLLEKCDQELIQVETIINGLGITSNVVPYLTKYALIRACGTIEQSFKSIIADFCSKRSKSQVKRFLDRKVRESSKNPTYSNICGMVADFDDNWKISFKTKVSSHRDSSQLRISLQSLVDARNDFAHGGSPTATIGDIINYFSHSREIIQILDDTVIS